MDKSWLSYIDTSPTEGRMNTRLCLRALAIIASLGTTAQVSAREPSFNCAKAVAHVEKQICESRELSELDRQIADRYADLREKLDVGRRNALLLDQREWIERRDICCDSANLLIHEHRRRLRELEAISSRPGAFTKDGWDAERPTIHGESLALLPASTQALVIRKTVESFQLNYLADSMSDLTLKDSHSGELYLNFHVWPVCHELSQLGVSASRTKQGKVYGVWSGIFFSSMKHLPEAQFEPDAVIKCTKSGAHIVVEVDDNYDPRTAESVVTNITRYSFDPDTNELKIEKIAPPGLSSEDLVGIFFDELRYHRIELVDGKPTVTEITDLHGTRLPIWPRSEWDYARRSLAWSTTQQCPIYYGGTHPVGIRFTVSTKTNFGLVAEVITETGSQSYHFPYSRRLVLQRVAAPLHRPLDYYYSKPTIARNELRRDFFEEHELEPDPREPARQAVCRKVDRQFVGFLGPREFTPTRDIGPIPAGFDPAKCRICMGDEVSRRQTCGFGRSAM